MSAPSLRARKGMGSQPVGGPLWELGHVTVQEVERPTHPFKGKAAERTPLFRESGTLQPGVH